MKRLTTSMNFSFDEQEGILTIHPPENFKEAETMEHARENVEYLTAVVGEKLKGILAYMPNHYIKAEVTRYYRHNAPDVPLALVAGSFFQKMIGNFLLSLSTGNRPACLFTSETEAKLWLKGKIGDY